MLGRSMESSAGRSNSVLRYDPGLPFTLVGIYHGRSKELYILENAYLLGVFVW